MTQIARAWECCSCTFLIADLSGQVHPSHVAICVGPTSRKITPMLLAKPRTTQELHEKLEQSDSGCARGAVVARCQ